MDEVKEKTKKKNHILIKIFLILIIILIVLGIALFGVKYFYDKNIEEQISQIETSNNNAIKLVKETIEYGDSITYESILEKLVDKDNLAEGSKVQIYINGNLLNESENYTFNEVGEFIISINITCNNENLKKSINTQKQVTWEVVDTKKPILTGVHDSEITAGDTFDVKSGISAKDEIDGDLEVQIEGDLDVTKAGEYTLTAKATDKNKNETTQTFKVTVKEKQVATSNNSSSKTNSSSSSKNSSSSSNKNTGSTSSSSSSSSKSSGSSSSGNKNSGSSSSSSTKAGREALAKAEAKRVVAKIIKAGMTKYEKAEAICMYIYNTVDSQHNQSTEAYKTNYGNEAYAALIMKIAACSGRCKAVTMLCDAAGLKSKHINKDLWEHQWNEIEVDDGKWVTVDSQIGLIEPIED